MQPACLDLLVIPGATNRQPLWMLQPYLERRPIADIRRTPSLELEVPDHGLDADWPVWVEGVTGWSELNRDTGRPPMVARLLDANSVEINEFNGANNRGSGGFLTYRPGIDLTGCSARMVLLGAGHELELSTDNGGLLIEGIGRMLIVITPGQSAAITWAHGSYTMDLTMANGDILRWLSGPVLVNNGGGCHACS